MLTDSNWLAGCRGCGPKSAAGREPKPPGQPGSRHRFPSRRLDAPHLDGTAPTRHDKASSVADEDLAGAARKRDRDRLPDLDGLGAQARLRSWSRVECAYLAFDELARLRPVDRGVGLRDLRRMRRES